VLNMRHSLLQLGSELAERYAHGVGAKAAMIAKSLASGRALTPAAPRR
jgi:hypothetical protein